MTFGLYNVDYEQRAYNPERMKKNRLDRAHAMLKKYGLGSMIVYDFDNHRYLGYYTWHNYMRRRPGRFLLLIRDQGWPYAPYHTEDTGEYQLMPYLRDKMILNHQPSVQSGMPSLDDKFNAEQWAAMADQVKGLLQQHHMDNLPIGIDAHFGFHSVDALQKAGLNVVDGNPAMAEARMIKNEDEIECCKIAGAITEAAHWEVCKALKPGLTEWQVCGIAAKALFNLGAEELEGPSFIVTNFGFYGIRTPTDRIIRPGELLSIDINGVSFQGYRTCFYRTYCVGDKPTEKQKELYQLNYEAQRSMELNMKPGISSHDMIRAILEDGGGRWPGSVTGKPFEFQGKTWGPTWPEPGYYFIAGIPGGHQLGLGSGDPAPGISPTWPAFTIEKGMVFAREVGVREWDGSKWSYDGCKIENSGVVTENGWESFYRFPYDKLITCGLPGVY